ncbi:hypothetical protein [Methylobacterium sp. SyP6R]|uniref:hypothetical protein n=1 Tax=Methylobacterium sp. SyP6R TaxID=2718876 RepID=UPI001F244D7A|nr:hypothetical protein [Methylobacterium sp. SyP6R]MCF4130159.1 hypothetical protein [Methylobacterium sp. SyP6R]
MLQAALADGFGSVLIEIVHGAGEIVEVGLPDAPRFRLDAATGGQHQASFLLSGPTAQAGPVPWILTDGSGRRERVLIAPTVLAKARFDAAVADLFRRAAETSLDGAASLVRIDKTGGFLRGKAGAARAPELSGKVRPGSVGILVCGGDTPFRRASCIAAGVALSRGKVALLGDLHDGNAAWPPAQGEAAHASIYELEETFLSTHDFVLLLAAGTLLAPAADGLIGEILGHFEPGTVVQIRTDGEARRLDALALMDGPAMRPRDFPLSGFYPVLARAADIRTVLAGRRCYASALGLVLDLFRGLEVLETLADGADGVVQVAPPPVSLHAREAIGLVRDCLEAIVPADRKAAA